MAAMKNKAWAFIALLLLPLLCLPLSAYADTGDTGPYAIEVYGPEPWVTEPGGAPIEIRVSDPQNVGWRQIVAVTTCDGLVYDLTESVELYGKAMILITRNTDIVVVIIAPDGTEYADSRRATLFQESEPQDSAVTANAQDAGSMQESASESNPATGGSEDMETVSSPAEQEEPAEDAASLATGKKTSMEQFPEESGDDADAVPPMNTDGTSTVIDNAVAEPSDREFFTVSTPLGNIYYLIVDRNSDSENVYFLNAVTERDLMALADEETQEEWASQAVQEPDDATMPDEVEPEEPTDEDALGETSEMPEEPASQAADGLNPMVIVAAVIIIGGAIGYYLKIVRPRKQLDDADDLENIVYLDDHNQQPEPDREDDYDDEDWGADEDDSIQDDET